MDWGHSNNNLFALPVGVDGRWLRDITSFAILLTLRARTSAGSDADALPTRVCL